MTSARQEGRRCRPWWLLAAELDEVLARGELVWAADQEGGGPHVYVDPEHPTRLIGFEVELAAMLAAELGVKARFQQGQWDRRTRFRRGWCPWIAVPRPTRGRAVRKPARRSHVQRRTAECPSG